MKTVFITYNQAYHEIIVRLLTKMSLRGYTSFERAGVSGLSPTLILTKTMPS